MLEWPQHLASPRSARPGFPNYSRVNAPLGAHPPQHRPTPSATPAAWALSTVLPARAVRKVRSRAGTPHSRDDLSTGLAPLERCKARRDVPYSVPDIPGAIERGPALWTVFELKNSLYYRPQRTFRPAQNRQEMEGKKEGKWPGKKVHSLPEFILRWGPGRHLFFRLIWLTASQPAFPLAALPQDPAHPSFRRRFLSPLHFSWLPGTAWNALNLHGHTQPFASVSST